MKAWTALLVISAFPALALAQQGARSPVAGGLPEIQRALSEETAARAAADAAETAARQTADAAEAAARQAADVAEAGARQAGDAATLAQAQTYSDAHPGFTVRPATAAECPFGGTAIAASTGTQLVCSGAPGQQGPPGAGATLAYTKRGQWYSGEGSGGTFSRTFETGEVLLTLELPAGSYLLTSHVFALPGRNDYDASILCSVGTEGGPVGSGEAKWLKAMDSGQSTAILALGTYTLATDGSADVRCYTSSPWSAGPDLLVAQASLTALRIDTLILQQ